LQQGVTSLSIMRLIPSPPGKIVGGEILYKGRDLLKPKWGARFATDR
jgi:ABC-type dipeptide/oligopeptide/nickel transport system ATPase component